MEDEGISVMVFLTINSYFIFWWQVLLFDNHFLNKMIKQTTSNPPTENQRYLSKYYSWAILITVGVADNITNSINTTLFTANRIGKMFNLVLQHGLLFSFKYESLLKYNSFFDVDNFTQDATFLKSFSWKAVFSENY